MQQTPLQWAKPVAQLEPLQAALVFPEQHVSPQHRQVEGQHLTLLPLPQHVEFALQHRALSPVPQHTQPVAQLPPAFEPAVPQGLAAKTRALPSPKAANAAPPTTPPTRQNASRLEIGLAMIRDTSSKSVLISTLRFSTPPSLGRRPV